MEKYDDALKEISRTELIAQFFKDYDHIKVQVKFGLKKIKTFNYKLLREMFRYHS